MATWRKTTYTEFVGQSGAGASPIFQLGQDMSRCQRILDVPWTGLYQAALDFLGYSEVVWDATNNVRYITRVTPHNIQPAGLSAGFQFLYCTQFSNVVGIGAPENAPGFLGVGRDYQDDADMAQYKLARISCAYETPDYSIRSDEEMISIGETDGYGHPWEANCARYVIRKSKPKGQYLNVPRGTMKAVGASLQSENKGINLQPGRIVPSTTVELTRVQVPARAVASQFVCADGNDSPINLINSTNSANDTNYLDRHLGTVNRFSLLGARIGTMLFTAVDLRPHRNAFGRRTFDVTLMFDFSPQVDGTATPATKFGHNLVPMLLDTSTLGWVEMTPAGTTNFGTYATGKNIYDFADHDDLFEVPAEQS